jgi:hypothetical protein
MNRLMLWWVHRHVEEGSQEMWRGSQMWVWISPNHIKAIWKVLVAENWLFKKLFAFEVSSCSFQHSLDHAAAAGQGLGVSIWFC